MFLILVFDMTGLRFHHIPATRRENLYASVAQICARKIVCEKAKALCQLMCDVSRIRYPGPVRGDRRTFRPRRLSGVSANETNRA
jgi:hypothetical protein